MIHVKSSRHLMRTMKICMGLIREIILRLYKLYKNYECHAVRAVWEALFGNESFGKISHLFAGLSGGQIGNILRDITLRNRPTGDGIYLKHLFKGDMFHGVRPPDMEFVENNPGMIPRIFRWCMELRVLKVLK